MTNDLALGVGALLVAVAYYLAAAAIPPSLLADAVGPAGLPTIYAYLLGGLAVVQIVRALEASRRQLPSSQRPAPDGAVARAAWLLAIGVVYVAVVPYLGYLISLGLLMGTTMIHQGGIPTRRVVVVAGSGALFFWLLFVVLLGIPHPPGFWPAVF